ncbi:MAG: glycine cleavage system protein GcvH, partial [Micrococcus sp.]|nr:glycine cleavage system protein GcvH [Micrococcus sp.]
MSSIPEGLKYSAEHEWVATTDDADVVRVGITDFAQDALGDVVYVDLPEVDSEVEAGSSVGEVESTKSVSDIYAPVSGTVTQVNEDLDGEPGLVNSAPYEGGWLFEVRVSDAAQVEALMDADGYLQITGRIKDMV